MATSALTTVRIARVSEAVYLGEASSVTVPGTDGYLTILAHHEPFITLLAPGTITVKESDGTAHQYPVESGVVEVAHNTITILM
jgi:F-type H+-transporting ATPase subunit epsilon